MHKGSSPNFPPSFSYINSSNPSFVKYVYQGAVCINAVIKCKLLQRIGEGNGEDGDKLNYFGDVIFRVLCVVQDFLY